MRGIDAQVDGNRGDAFVGPGDPVGFCFDLLPNLIKICELFALTMEELCIFWRRTKETLE